MMNVIMPSVMALHQKPTCSKVAEYHNTELRVSFVMSVIMMNVMMPSVRAPYQKPPYSWGHCVPKQRTYGIFC
jgi:hypothetical protein